MRLHHRPSPAPLSAKRSSSLPSRLDAARIRRLADMFGLLSSPTRLRIFHALAMAGELHVQGVADALRMRVTAVSNQLRLMAILGVLAARSEGLRVIYSVEATWAPALMADALAQLRAGRSKRR
ncbi:MAG: TrmB/ArsR family transcriptional [Planctomycetota bacterium]|nr:MAG: TrmB/ArsR family transcriptional [Planctomycetota bacterium]